MNDENMFFKYAPSINDLSQDAHLKFCFCPLMNFMNVSLQSSCMRKGCTTRFPFVIFLAKFPS